MNNKIESEEKRERLTDSIKRWCEHTKIAHLLRDHDIPSLVRTIINEFYSTTLCCGHLVKSIDEGVPLDFEDLGGEVHGIYCAVCAEEYKRELGAWETQDE